MPDEAAKTCVQCQGEMSPILVMDRDSYGMVRSGPQQLAYRRPDDTQSFWTGKYPSAGLVHAFMCSGCGRIALYGRAPDA